MRSVLRVFLVLGLLVTLSACSTKFFRYEGPEVTRIVVMKSARRMYLLNGKNVLRSYQIGLGFSPRGDKKVEGDGKTPEGLYYINRRNPESEFHLSLGINYPNARDVAEAKKLGKRPGGDIFIHGRGNPVDFLVRDWTWGCIAVTNKEMEEIYSMVRLGTPIAIYK